MAIEPKRGCGYRKVGGTYLMGGKLSAPCCKLPLTLDICPCCNQGIKQTRGWTWFNPIPFFSKTACAYSVIPCPASDPTSMGDKVGLLWIGEKFYPTPVDFEREAAKQGISRRISAVPRGFKLGMWVMLAHPKAIHTYDPEAADGNKFTPGIFAMFIPTHIEKIVTKSESEDEEAMNTLREKGITPFVVPDDDRDHQGTVYDRDESAEEPEGLFV